MNIKDIIELAKLVDGNSGSATSEEKANLAGQHIVVLDRGFVYAGNVSRDGDCLRISEAKNIRVWGTTNGLGELRHGPTPSTKCDPVGEVIAPFKSIIHLIPCSGF